LKCGWHFKAPKKTDKRQWGKIRFLLEHGFGFLKIRLGKNSNKSIAYPKTLAEAKNFEQKYKDYAVPK
jgi:hypothetical protein